MLKSFYLAGEANRIAMSASPQSLPWRLRRGGDINVIVFGD
jgi:hypothetical protein